jgi:hypothetical protein
MHDSNIYELRKAKNDLQFGTHGVLASINESEVSVLARI